MARRLKSASAVSPVCPLSVNDLIFVNAFLANGRNGTKAYQQAHPNATYGTANGEAVRVLAKPSVQREIGRRIQYDGGITKELVQTHLLRALDLANDAKDAVVIASVSMDCAKLAGFLVEKREVKDTTEKESQLRDLVRSSLASTLSPSCSSPSLTPTTNGN